MQIIRPRGTTGAAQAMLDLKSQLWREGAIATQFPAFKRALLPLLDSLHIVRGLGLTRRPKG